MIDCIKQGGGQLPLVVQIQMCHMLESLSKLLFFFHIQMHLMKYKYSLLNFKSSRVKFKCFIGHKAIYTVHQIFFLWSVIEKKEHNKYTQSVYVKY